MFRIKKEPVRPLRKKFYVSVRPYNAKVNELNTVLREEAIDLVNRSCRNGVIPVREHTGHWSNDDPPHAIDPDELIKSLDFDNAFYSHYGPNESGFQIGGNGGKAFYVPFPEPMSIFEIRYNAWKEKHEEWTQWYNENKDAIKAELKRREDAKKDRLEKQAEAKRKKLEAEKRAIEKRLAEL